MARTVTMPQQPHRLTFHQGRRRVLCALVEADGQPATIQGISTHLDASYVKTSTSLRRFAQAGWAQAVRTPGKNGHLLYTLTPKGLIEARRILGRKPS